MKWRDVLVGAIATLIVTILSGVAVFYLTQAPDEKPTELLGYTIESSASFESVDNQVAMVTVSIINLGDAKAESLLGSIAFPVGKIKDKKVVPSAGKVSGFTITSETDQQIDFSMPCLHPNERVAVSFLLESLVSPEPSISLKSSKSIGKKLSFTGPTAPEKASLLRRILSSLTPLFFGLIMTLALLLTVKFRLLPRLPRSSCLNNNGFVFLHKNLNDLAERLLQRAVEQGENGPHAISNYATSLAIAGKGADALKYVEAAEFLARSPHEKAVVAFNQALISLNAQDTQSARKQLEKALALSKKEISFYCRSSSLFLDLTATEPDIRALIKNK